jgi:hypothetical protein
LGKCAALFGHFLLFQLFGAREGGLLNLHGKVLEEFGDVFASTRRALKE